MILFEHYFLIFQKAVIDCRLIMATVFVQNRPIFPLGFDGTQCKLSLTRIVGSRANFFPIFQMYPLVGIPNR